MPSSPDVPPAIAFVGRKNSGKTTLLVAVAAELKRRGRRVATMKHGHHEMQIDQPGRDSWRHLHEGGAEAVVLVAGTRVAAVVEWGGEPDPVELVRRFHGGRGYDVVLVEGYKRGPFPMIEVFRRAAHDAPIHDPAAAGSPLLAIVTDDETLAAGVPVVRLGDPARADATHVARVADLVEAAIAAAGGRAR